MKKLLCGLILMMPIAGYSETVEEMYPAPWLERFNADINKALASSQIRGCGQYRYRVSTRSSSEFLVYCSRDGKNWLAYMVWPKISKVLGPYQPDPDLQ
ncbi:hypothetical protein [Pseudomonas congelans]|uniref:hypothetical protein n=1 Tax=Pseudomonas congelans TaxID=200452 RepID=UPI00117B114F|nr:hypothetical protein [Pseudomonas congelans]